MFPSLALFPCLLVSSIKDAWGDARKPIEERRNKEIIFKRNEMYAFLWSVTLSNICFCWWRQLITAGLGVRFNSCRVFWWSLCLPMCSCLRLSNTANMSCAPLHLIQMRNVPFCISSRCTKARTPCVFTWSTRKSFLSITCLTNTWTWTSSSLCVSCPEAQKPFLRAG